MVRTVASTAQDPVDVRGRNLARVLRTLRDTGPVSRARLADATGLTRATVSSLVSELNDRGLVRDGAVARGAIGRPGQYVEVTGAVCGLGVEINVGYLAAQALDLSGAEVTTHRAVADAAHWSPERTLDTTAALITTALDRCTKAGRCVAGIGVAVPGLVEAAPGVVRLAPNMHWYDTALAEELARRIGRPDLPLTIDNDANLSALAEYRVGASAGVGDLVYLTGEAGVGAGILVEGRLLRGADGFGGEVGHMAVAIDGRQCGCGRRGCWETLVGLQALLDLVADADDPVADHALDLQERMSEVRARAESGDARTLAGLEQVGTNLGHGASIIVNMVNPRVIVLGGFYSVLAEFIIPSAEETLRERVVAPPAAICRIEASALGFTAAALGGALMVLENVLSDPVSVRISTTEATHE
jgi:predicted NBD/HSP70 family sugar kinase